MSTASFQHRSQPTRTIFLAYKLAQLIFLYIPAWAIYYVIPWSRPIPKWSWHRALFVRVLGHFFGLLSKTGPGSILSPNHRSLDTRFGVKGVWIPAVPQLIHSNLLTWSRVAKVESISIPGYWIDRPGRKTLMGCPPMRTEKCIMMLHSGAMIGGSAHPLHPFSLLPRQLVQYVSLARRVFSVEYRLSSAAPFEAANPFPAALLDALAGYNYLVNVVGFEPSNIILAGDSAGGNLAMALTRYLVDNCSNYRDLPSPPGSLILLSPWVDLSASHIIRPCHTDYLGNADVLQLLEWAKRAYTGPHGTGSASYNPYISPASSSLQSGATYGFPRTFIAAGGAEYLIHQIRALKNQMSAYTDVYYHEAVDSAHDWISLGLFHEPEVSAALRAIAKWTSMDKSRK